MNRSFWNSYSRVGVGGTSLFIVLPQHISISKGYSIAIKMLKISSFEKYAQQYDEWFVENRWVYEAELRAVKRIIIRLSLFLPFSSDTVAFR